MNDNIAKYEIHGYIKPTLQMPWIHLDPPQGFDTDDYLQIQDLMRRIGINYYIIEVRRNEKWVEPSLSATSTDKGLFGTKLGTIYNPKTDSTSSETPSTEDPMDTQ